jgi:nitroreductase
MLNKIKIMAAAVMFALAVYAQDTKEIKLPAPDKTGGMPLMEALANRQSSREFSNKELTNQQLSDLLWATWGVNRSDGRRTAPSARNTQATEVFVVKTNGVFKYNAQKNVLELVKAGDNRKIAGGQAFAKNAPLNILLITDMRKIGSGKSTQDELLTAYIDAGFIGQNTSLYAASEKLNCVVRLMIDRDEIRKVLGLGEEMLPVMGITIGN